MPNIGPVELIIILVIALIVIGPGRLPDVGAALGKSIREFRKASSEVADATRIDTGPLPPTAGAAPAPTPEPPVASQTSSIIPGPIATPAPPMSASPASAAPASDDEPKNLPA